MKQSDIVSFAINGVQRELADAEERVIYLTKTLHKLYETDKSLAEPVEHGGDIGRPAEFVANCARCRQRPCICGHM